MHVDWKKTKYPYLCQIAWWKYQQFHQKVAKSIWLGHIQLGEKEYTESDRYLLQQWEYIYQDYEIFLNQNGKSALGSYNQNEIQDIKIGLQLKSVSSN